MYKYYSSGSDLILNTMRKMFESSFGLLITTIFIYGVPFNIICMLAQY